MQRAGVVEIGAVVAGAVEVLAPEHSVEAY